MIIGELLAHIGFRVEKEPLEKLSESLDSIKEKLNLIIGVEAVTKLYELAERFAHWGEELHLTAENIGITTDELQGLNFAAEKSGISQEELTQSLSHLARQLYAAKTGSKEAQEQFAKMGISGDQIARFKNTEDALHAVSDQIAKIEDPIKRMGVAQELLGRGGVKMIAFLSQGSKKIAEEGAELKKLGLQLSGPQVEALVEVDDAFLRLHAVMAAIGAQIASYVGPAFTFLVDKFIGLYAANKDIVGSGLTSWLDTLLGIFGAVSGVVYALTRYVLHMGKAFKDAFDKDGLAGVFDLLAQKVQGIFSGKNLKGLTEKIKEIIGGETFSKGIKLALDAALVATGWAASIGAEIATGFIGAVIASISQITLGDEDIGNGLRTTAEGLIGRPPPPSQASGQEDGKSEGFILKNLRSLANAVVGAPPGVISSIATSPQAALRSANQNNTAVGGNVTVHAPVTINNNIPAGATPAHAEALGKAAARGAVKEFHDETMRRTIQSLPGGS